MHFQEAYSSTCAAFQLSPHALPQYPSYEICNASTNKTTCQGGAAPYFDQFAAPLRPLLECYPPTIGPVFLHAKDPNGALQKYIIRDAKAGLVYGTALTTAGQFEIEMVPGSDEFRNDYVFQNAQFPSQFMLINESVVAPCNNGSSCRPIILATQRDGQDPSLWRLSGAPLHSTSFTIESIQYPGWYLTLDPSSSAVVISDTAPLSNWFIDFLDINTGEQTAATLISPVSVGPVITNVSNLAACASHGLRSASAKAVQYDSMNKTCLLSSTIAVNASSPSRYSVWNINTVSVAPRTCASRAINAFCNTTVMGPYLMARANAAQDPINMVVLAADEEAASLRMDATLTSILQRQWVMQQVDNSNQVFLFLHGTSNVVDRVSSTAAGAPLILELDRFDPDASGSWMFIQTQASPLQGYLLASDSLLESTQRNNRLFLCDGPALLSEIGDARASATPSSSLLQSSCLWQFNSEVDDARNPILTDIHVTGVPLTILTFTPWQLTQCISSCKIQFPECDVAVYTASASMCQLGHVTSMAFNSGSTGVSVFVKNRAQIIVPGNHPEDSYEPVGGSSLLCSFDGIEVATITSLTTPTYIINAGGGCYPLQLNPVRIQHLSTGLTLSGTNSLFTQLGAFQGDGQQFLDYLVFVQTDQIGVYYIHLLPMAPGGNTQLIFNLDEHAPLIMDPDELGNRLHFSTLTSNGFVANAPPRWHVRDVSLTSGTLQNVVIESADYRGRFLAQSEGEFVVVKGSAELSNLDPILWSVSMPDLTGASSCSQTICTTNATLTNSAALILNARMASMIECQTMCSFYSGSAPNSRCYMAIFRVIDAYHGNCSLYKSAATFTPVASTFITCCQWFSYQPINPGVTSLSTLDNSIFGVTRGPCYIPHLNASTCAIIGYTGVVQPVITGHSFPIYQSAYAPPSGDQEFYVTQTNLPNVASVFYPSIDAPTFVIFSADDTTSSGDLVAYNSAHSGGFVLVPPSTAGNSTLFLDYQFVISSATGLDIDNSGYTNNIFPGGFQTFMPSDVLFENGAIDALHCASQCLSGPTNCLAVQFTTAQQARLCTAYRSFYTTSWDVDNGGLTTDPLSPGVVSWIRDFGVTVNVLGENAPTVWQLSTASGSLLLGRYAFWYPQWGLSDPLGGSLTNPLVGLSFGQHNTGQPSTQYAMYYNPGSLARTDTAFPGAPNAGPTALPSGGGSFFSIIWTSATTFLISLQYAETYTGTVLPIDDNLRGAYLCYRPSSPNSGCVTASQSAFYPLEATCLNVVYDQSLCELTFVSESST